MLQTRTRLLSNAARSSFRPTRLVSCPLPISRRSTRTSLSLPCRASSSLPGLDGLKLFEYTSGSWLVNRALRMQERRHKFNDDGLCRLAAEFVGRPHQDVHTLEKIEEGATHRVFLITMKDGFKMIARIPYPVTDPKYYTIASEAATMTFLRGFGLPVPEVYGYSPTPDNAAETEFILTEFVEGEKLSEAWLSELDLASVLHQIAQVEAHMMSIPFPAGGSIYFASDMEKVPEGKVCSTIPLFDDRFCIGPDVRFHMWYGRRSLLDINRGPYEDAEAALTATARKEITYLKRFGRPLLPFQRSRRDAYNYEEQSPQDHIKNLERYLLLATSLLLNNCSLQEFCIRHPGLQLSNIMVTTSPDKSLKLASLLNWQHTAVLPRFLLAGIPRHFQNYGDPVSGNLKQPKIPPDAHKLEPAEQEKILELHRARLLHYAYAKGTKRFNQLNYDGMSDPASAQLRALFDEAGCPWEGETHYLKMLLIKTTEEWAKLVGAGVPCPVEFDPDDVRKTKEFNETLKLVGETHRELCALIGVEETEAMISNESYKEAKAMAGMMKLKLSMALPEGKMREQFLANWFLDDMDEEDYK